MLPSGPPSYSSNPRAGCPVSVTSARLVLCCQEESYALLHYNCCICPRISVWTRQDGPKTKGWTVGSGPKVLCRNNAPVLISESPRSSRDKSLEESQLDTVVPTSGSPAPPRPSSRFQGPLLSKLLQPFCVRPGLAYCLPRPQANPCSCRERGLGRRPACQSWETGKRNKSSKMFRCGGSCGRPQYTTPQPRDHQTDTGTPPTHTLTLIIQKGEGTGRQSPGDNWAGSSVLPAGGTGALWRRPHSLAQS